MFDFIGKWKLWFAISALTIIFGVVALFVWGLKFSLDFTGGSLMELSFKDARPTTEQVLAAMTQAGFEQVQIQPSAEKDYILRTVSIDETKHQETLKALHAQLKTDFTELRFESIGPVIGQELRTKSIWSIFAVLIAIIAFIAFAFRKVSKPVASWKYGIAAVIALAHDLITAVGLYALVAHFAHWEVDGLFITALLTILGFSVHDTIVTFDRTRELLHRTHDDNYEHVVNSAVNQTIVRSLNTSITALLVLTALFLFGGESTKHFIFTLLIGIFIGTYSSIFIASPIVVLWNKVGKKG